MSNQYINLINNELQVLNLNQDKTKIGLTLNLKELSELINCLKYIFTNPSSEVKISLKQNISIYFKLVESSVKSKLMLARPQTNEMVASIHISSVISQELLDELSKMNSVGTKFSFNSLRNIYPLSNLVFEIEVI